MSSVQQSLFKAIEREKEDFACVFHNRKAYVAFCRTSNRICETPTLKLIQNIFETHKDLSFFILRNRIFTSFEKNELDLGLIRVTAKRIRFAESLHSKEIQKASQNLQEFEIIGQNQLYFQSQYQKKSHFQVGRKFSSIEEAFFFLKNQLLEQARESSTGLPLHDRNRQVAAILLDAENHVLAGSLNSSAINKTLHAEINLLQNYTREHGALPKGSTLVVTHKPCKMCAGMIFSAAEDPFQIQVLYQTEESGAHSVSTVLDRYQINRQVT